MHSTVISKNVSGFTLAGPPCTIRLHFQLVTTVLCYGLPVLGCCTAASVNRSARVRLAGYVALTLVTFDKESNGVDSKSNRVIYNDHISFYVTARHIT